MFLLLTYRCDVFIVNFEHISHLSVMFILLTLNKYMLVGLCFFLKYKNFEKTKIFYVNTIKASDSVELLGIASDRNFNFKRHSENICCKANNKTKDFFYIMKLLVLSKHKY